VFNPQIKGTHTTATTEPEKTNTTTLRLHNLHRNSKIPVAKHLLKVKKNHDGKATDQTKRGGKTSARLKRPEQLKVMMGAWGR